MAIAAEALAAGAEEGGTALAAGSEGAGSATEAGADNVAASRARLKAAGFNGRPQARQVGMRKGKATGFATPERKPGKRQMEDYEADLRSRSPRARVARAAASTARAGYGAARAVDSAVSSPSGRSGIFLRLIVAAAVALGALELASQVSGNYFNWNLKQGAQNVGTAAKAIGFYPGQQEKLAARAAGTEGQATSAAAHPSAGVVA